MTRILGIDPGSRITGFGIIEIRDTRSHYIDSGCIRAGDGSFAERLKCIYDGLRQLVQHYQPGLAAVEQVFMNRNADSALKLGQARGAALCALMSCELKVHEYSPREIKQAIVGSGGADKTQIQHMVRVLLSLKGSVAADAADALAVALCHQHTRQGLARRQRAAGHGIAIT